jgi:ubiquitin carboxyl-terminal hydrolase 14
MAPLAVHVKHAGKTLDVSLDPDQPPSVFKDAVYQVTGIPPDRMKVMIKGGVLKVCLSPIPALAKYSCAW